MMSLLVFKERLKELYVRFGAGVGPLVKFLFSFTALLLINKNAGFTARLASPWILLLLAFISAFLPYGAISVLTAVFLLVHLSGVSLEIAFVMAVFFLVVALLYYGFQPGDSCLLILTPMCFLLNVPYAVPLIVGLTGSVVSVIPVSCGVVVYYALLYVKQNVGALASDISVSQIQKITQFVKGVLSNKNMLAIMAAFALALVVVAIIRSLSVDYSWMIAAGAGTMTQLGVIFAANIAADVPVSVGKLLIGILFSVFLAAVYIFFVFAVDYSRTEYVQFEDDDYYYYVKAVPKVTVSTPDVKVKKINASKLQRPKA